MIVKGKLNEHTTGIIVGAFAGVMHAIWSLFVAGGFAQTFLNWIFGLHFLANPYRVMPFDITTAITLVVVTSLVGYALGWIFASIWNSIIKK